MPELPVVDEIYPRLINDYLGPGLVGLVVAGVLAGGISTYDSIGSSLGAGIALRPQLVRRRLPGMAATLLVDQHLVGLLVEHRGHRNRHVDRDGAAGLGNGRNTSAV